MKPERIRFEETTGIAPLKRFRRWWWQMVLGLLAVALLGGLLVWFAVRTTRQMPAFYREILQKEQPVSADAGDEFESNVVGLANEMQQAGPWSAVFTQDQVNGWLATDLPQKFPRALPPELQNPRVEIRDRQVRLALTVKSKKIDAYIVVQGDVYCTTAPNQIAVRIDSVTSGWLPIPITQWTDEIARRLRDAECDVVWTEENGKTLALITLPGRDLSDGDRYVESIECAEGKVTIHGQTYNGDEPM